MDEASGRKKRLHPRSLTSFGMALSFGVAALSGVVLYLAPPGGRARAEGWTFWHLGRDGWMAQHITICAVLLLLALVHLYLNARVLWCYVRSRAARGIHRKWELAIAVLLAAYMVVGTLYALPPWNYVLRGSRHLGAYRGEAERLRQGQGHRPAGPGRDGGDEPVQPRGRGGQRWRGGR